MPVQTLPDALALVAAYLRDDPDVAALVADRVGTRVPDGAQFPLIRLHRTGGLPVTESPLWADAARIQVEAFADTEAAAHDVAATAQAVLLQMRGTVTAGALTGVVSGVASAIGLQDVPDPDTDHPRYLFAVTVYIHPTPA